MKTLLLLLTVLLSLRAEAKPDLLIYGATPGGIAAAVSAAKQGRDVLIVEPTDRIGGMLTSGLSYSDFRTLHRNQRHGLATGEEQLARNHGRAIGEPARVRIGIPTVSLILLGELGGSTFTNALRIRAISPQWRHAGDPPTSREASGKLHVAVEIGHRDGDAYLGKIKGRVDS